jgi:hypothetical protein
MKTAKIDSTVLIEGRVIKAGNKLAFLQADVYLKDKDSFDLNKKLLIASGSHTKYIL